MKAWLKVLVWLGLGGGIGFFAGYQAGYQKDKKEVFEQANELLNQKDRDAENRIAMRERAFERAMEAEREACRMAVEAVKDYAGIKDDAVISEGQISMEELDEEEPEMPMEEPEMPDDSYLDREDEEDEEEEEIEQPHPEDFLPRTISEAEFRQNPEGYDVTDLDYYTDDDVVFEPKREEKWTHPEQLLGIGWKAGFIGGKGIPLDTIYIRNDTMGMLYRVSRIEDSFSELYEEE